MKKEMVDKYFVKVDPEENKRELAELAKTEEGARAIRNFEREMDFRRTLAVARKEARLSQKEVSKRSGLKQQAISRFENGDEDKGVTLSTLIRYTDALGLDLSLKQRR